MNVKKVYAGIKDVKQTLIVNAMGTFLPSIKSTTKTEDSWIDAYELSDKEIYLIIHQSRYNVRFEVYPPAEELSLIQKACVSRLHHET